MYKIFALSLLLTFYAPSCWSSFYNASDDYSNTGGSSLLFAAHDASVGKTLFVNLGVRLHEFDWQQANETAYRYDLSSIAGYYGHNLQNSKWGIVAGDDVWASCSYLNSEQCGRSLMATVSSNTNLPDTSQLSDWSFESAIYTFNHNWFMALSPEMKDVYGSHLVQAGELGSWETVYSSLKESAWDFAGENGESLEFGLAYYRESFYRVGIAEEYTISSVGTWSLAGEDLCFGSIESCVTTEAIDIPAPVPLPAGLLLFASGLATMRLTKITLRRISP